VLAPLFDDDSAPRDLLAHIEATIDPLAIRLRVARRDLERVRQILLVQRRLAQARKRGGRIPAGFLSRDYAGEALALHALFYQVARQAEGVDLASSAVEVQGWPLPRAERLGDAEPPAERSPSERDGQRRRRRRPSGPESYEESPARLAEARDDGPEGGPGDVDEDAAIAAYTAALERKADDD
jgi:hypothetical protein